MTIRYAASYAGGGTPVGGGANAVDAPDGTGTTTTGNVSWTDNWTLTAPGGNLNSGTHPVRLVCKKEAGQSGTPSVVVTITSSTQGTLFTSSSVNITATTYTDTLMGNMTASGDVGTLTMNVNVTAAGGNPGTRTSIQVDSMYADLNVAAAPIAKSDSDTLTMSVTDNGSVAVVFDSKSDSDTATISVTDTESVNSATTVNKSDTDTATIGVTESTEYTISVAGGGAPAAFVAASTSGAGDTNNTSHSVSKPAGTANGDLVLITATFWAEPSTATTPAGCTLISSLTTTAVINGGSLYHYVWAKVAGAETSYTSTHISATWGSMSAISITSWNSGVALTALNKNTAVQPTATANQPSTSLTVAANSLIVNLVGNDNSGSGSHTPPTNYTEVADQNGVAINYRAGLTAGAQTISGGTFTEANSWAVTSIEVPASGGSSSQTRVFGDTDTATVIVTDGGEDIVTGGAPVTTSDSDTATVSVAEAESIVQFIDQPGADTATISVTESESIVVQTQKYVRGISANGRYFVDQNDDPIFIKGDSPWGILVNNTPAQAATYWTSRASQGFNVAIASALPDGANGADSTSGQTYDGVAPFIGGDVTNPNETYWARIDQHLNNAADAGITVFFYPVDSWTAVSGNQSILSGTSTGDLATYGTWIAQRYASMPNLVWMVGGDYFEPFNDATFTAVLDAVIAELGTSNIITGAQLFEPEWTTRQTTGAWSAGAGRVDYNFIYVYDVAYDLVQQAYNQIAKPALMSENKYLDEGGLTPTMFRRNTLWSYTSGSPGDIVGSTDWPMSNGTWQNSIVNSPDSDFVQHDTYSGWFEALDGWYDLVPDTGDTFILTGRGTKVVRTDFTEGSEDIPRIGTNDYASATVKADGTMAVAYLPTQRAITLDLSQLNSNPVAKWVHPTTLAETAIANPATSITPPAAGDWLLYITADSAAVPISDSDTLTVSVADTEAIAIVLQAITDSDTATVSASDAEASAGTVLDSDTVTISVTDSEAVTQINTNVSQSDTATISVTEAEVILVTLSDSDTATVSASDVAGSGGTVTDSDTATVSITEDGTPTVTGNNPADGDTATITVAETEIVDVGTPATDTASVAVAETETIFVTLSDSDTLTPSVTEDASFGQGAQADSDTATVSVVEAQQVDVILETKTQTDTATISVAEAETTIVFVSDNDNLQPAIVEGEVLGLTLSDTDSLTISITESENATGAIPWTVQAWVGATLVESGQVQVWDGTQLISITLDEPLVWDGTQFIPLT